MNISDDADSTKMFLFLSFSLKDQNLLSRQNLLLKKSPGKKIKPQTSDFNQNLMKRIK